MRSRLKATHLAWAALAIAAATALVLVPQNGHPPPIILLPLVALAWPLGHALIWGIGWLAARGRRSAFGSESGALPRPAAVVAALVGTGVVALAGVVQLVGSGLQGRWYPYPEPAPWCAMLLFALVHGICFIALLLRKRWSHRLGAALALGWAGLTGAQLVGSLAAPGSARIPELLLGVGVMLSLCALAICLAASGAVRSFFGR